MMPFLFRAIRRHLLPVVFSLFWRAFFRTTQTIAKNDIDPFKKNLLQNKNGPTDEKSETLFFLVPKNHPDQKDHPAEWRAIAY